MSAGASRNPDVLPVVMGGDVGAYSLGLECYEAFGVRSLCLAASPVAMITESRLFDVRPFPAKATDEQVLGALADVARQYPDKKKVLLSTSDSHVATFAKNRALLDKDFCIPYASEEAGKVVADKITFYALAESLGIAAPASEVVDFSAAGDPQWTPPTTDVPFPVVAKASSGDAYNRVHFPRKKKIWFVDDEAELKALWVTLRDAGFRDRFVVQQVIPGDDTGIRNLTLYVGRDGKVLLRGGAQVLLEDPSPTLIGNPVAMISQELPELWNQAEKILRTVDYRGFANFDVKIDPNTSVPYFLDANPRIGRTSYYMVAGGVNPMVPMVRDLCFGENPKPVSTTRRALFSLVPLGLIKKYVADPELSREATHLAREGLLFDPLRSPVETSVKRKATAFLQRFNYYRKFKAYWRF